MTHPTKRDLEREVSTIEATQRSELRQTIPYDLAEEWAEFSGHDMNWIYHMEGR